MTESDTVRLHPALLERLVAIARRMVELRRPREAADLLEIAAVLSPQGAHLLDEAEKLREQPEEEDFERELRRRNLESSHAIGMGHIFQTRGDLDRAMEMFDFAKLRTRYNYLGYAAAGFLHLRNDNPAEALREFSQARRLNPLDLRLAIETSRAAMQIESYKVALEHAIDALLLSQWETDREQHRDRRRVTTLARLSETNDAGIDALIAERAKALQKACDHVALSQARIFSARHVTRRRKVMSREPVEREDLIVRAAELRQMALLGHFNDDQLIALARLVHPAKFDEAQVIFREDLEGRDLYLVREGAVHMTRRTAAGTQILAALGPGSVFGEVAFLDEEPRSATAIGTGEGSLFMILAGELEAAIESDRELAVSLLWAFWKALTGKVRAANLEMGEMWESGIEDQERETRHEPGEPVSIDTEEKLDLLRSQGLSGQELRLLASFAHERRFQPESVIFTEGERGDSLYIVVDGAVRISRLVPGVGEECLTILHRGDIFGEMALVDGQPRSADARAHSEGCTIFSISRSALHDALAMDPDASVQFLTLLCRILCRRLRAMNDRLVAWRVMAAHQ
ncbi:MAG: cyclic nucleotide-binding domain-containing protein [Acidobacteria bacterium]|nr:cyclic nucleotide-binding domain-containing protein [Acidobacteriota bacterium]